MTKNKIASAIALLLMFAMVASLVALPAANAHTPPWEITTWAFLSVQPNPVGVGQEAFVNFWTDKLPTTATGPYGDRWQDMTVKVTKPDGTTETLGPFASDATGGAFTRYVPNQIGTYTFVFYFPGYTLTGANPNPVFGTFNPNFVGDYFEPSTSPPVTLTVQEEAIQPKPLTPLPTSYWTRPILSSNTEWYSISGNWLGLNPVSFGTAGQYNVSGNFNPYTKAPNTAHIVWTRPIAVGGLIGGEFGNTLFGSNFMSTSQYEPKFQPIIINGVLYYTLFPGSSTSPAGWVAVDMRTGKELWTKNTAAQLRGGQVLNFISPNQYGGIPYLWSVEPTVPPNTGTTYGMYDAMTGNWILNIVNGTGYIPGTAGYAVTSGTPTVTLNLVPDDSGNLIGYYVNATDATLNKWNSTKAIMSATVNLALSGTAEWMWRTPQGASIDFAKGIEWSVNVTRVPTAVTGLNFTVPLPLSIRKIGTDVIMMGSFGETGEVTTFSWNKGYQIEAGYSAIDGRLLWGPLNRTITPWSRVNMGRVMVAMDGVYNEYEMATFTHTGYSLLTGQKLWGPTAPFNTTAWGLYEAQSIAGYGNFYTNDFGGGVHAYKLSTGERLWDWYTESSGYETPYGTYPILKLEAVADGKVFALGGHMYSPPLFRGSRLYALNATTGEEIWNILCFPNTNSATAALADGYMVEVNAYDNQIYCFGKGLTATSVEAPMAAITIGDSLVIRGTVTDQSAGAKGTPAIADAYMTPWMEYLYMQQPKPTDAKGVEVTLDVIDSNNNYRNIGTATTDINGFFSYMWTPDIVGKYTVVATFKGSESYWSSNSETAFGVMEAPEPTLGPTAQPASLADIYFLPMSIIILVAIAIVGALILLMLRKR